MRSPVAIVVAALLLASCTPSSDGMHEKERVYQGSAGWSVEVPAGWSVLPFNMSKGDVSARGAQISNVELPPPEIQPGLPIQTSSLVLPPDGVSLIIAADLDPSVRVPLPHRRDFHSHWMTSLSGAPQVVGRRSGSSGSWSVATSLSRRSRLAPTPMKQTFRRS
jgi:hypothetical protein